MAAEEEAGGPAGNGHNSELTTEQKRALFFHHLEIVKRQKKKCDSETATLRNFYKKAKADGVTKRSLEWAMRLENADDDKMDDIREARRAENEIAAWLNAPIGTQADMFDDGPNNVHEAQGFREASEGKPANAENLSGDAHQSYMTGWHRGDEQRQIALQKVTRDELDEADKVLPPRPEGTEGAPKKRRGRRPKNQPPAVH